MNKRVKLKKGIFHKKCDDSCWLYRNIKGNKFFINFGCERCKFNGGKEIEELLKANTPSNVIIIDMEGNHE